MTTLSPLRDALTNQQKRLLDSVYYAMTGEMAAQFSDFNLRDRRETQQNDIVNQVKGDKGLKAASVAWNSMHKVEPSRMEQPKLSQQQTESSSRDSSGQKRKRARPTHKDQPQKKQKVESRDIPSASQDIPQEIKDKVAKLKPKLKKAPAKRLLSLFRSASSHLDFILTELDLSVLPERNLLDLCSKYVTQNLTFDNSRKFIRYALLNKLLKIEGLSRTMRSALTQLYSKHPQAVMEELLIPLVYQDNQESTGPHCVNAKSLPCIKILVQNLNKRHAVAFLQNLLSSLERLVWNSELISVLCSIVGHKSRPVTSTHAATLLVHMQKQKKDPNLEVITQRLLSIMIGSYREEMKPHINLLQELDSDGKLVRQIEQLEQ